MTLSRSLTQSLPQRPNSIAPQPSDRLFERTPWPIHKSGLHFPPVVPGVIEPCGRVKSWSPAAGKECRADAGHGGYNWCLRRAFSAPWKTAGRVCRMLDPDRNKRRAWTWQTRRIGKSDAWQTAGVCQSDPEIDQRTGHPISIGNCRHCGARSQRFRQYPQPLFVGPVPPLDRRIDLGHHIPYRP